MLFKFWGETQRLGVLWWQSINIKPLQIVNQLYINGRNKCKVQLKQSYMIWVKKCDKQMTLTSVNCLSNWSLLSDEDFDVQQNEFPN